MRKNTFLIALGAIVLNTLFSFSAKADEGMWIPLYLKQLNYEKMKQLGLQLSADEIYSTTQPSLKDVVVVLSGGSCTAEIISAKGLLLTNHHCAYEGIQQNSSTEHDYLTDGFWSPKKSQELKVEGMTASLLVRIEDVTSKIDEATKDLKSEEERAKAIQSAIADMVKTATEGTHYEAKVKSYYHGNEYYLLVYETFRDIRLVGAPPSAIGKFGGDTDNWMWPRHTGDFSLLRIYTGPDGKPADYSENNVPLKPKKHLEISLDGVEKGDYAMVMGYPGRTDRYLTSYGVKLALEKDQPAIIKLREKRLALMKEDMNASSEVRIKYAAKYAQVSNYYKYFIGQSTQLKKHKIYDLKKAEENAFSNWVNADKNRAEVYGNPLKDIEAAYQSKEQISLVQTYLNEAIFGSEIFLMGYRSSRLNAVLTATPNDKIKVDAEIQALKGIAEEHYKDYNVGTDQKITAALWKYYANDIAAEYQPALFKSLAAKYKGDFDKMAADLFAKSIFSSKEKLEAFLTKPSAKALQKDQVFMLVNDFLSIYRGKLNSINKEVIEKLSPAMRLYVKGIREMNPSKNYAPDANSTMRVTYGQVLDYSPADAVYYTYYTTLDGVMEKEDPSNDEFIVPSKLKELWANKDYGKYAENGKIVTCFITNNDITGGNSGSPVMNAKGQLIGVAFDGNWEAMSGDISFEKDLQRTIVTDIRYVLFVIDKYAGAENIIDELNLVKTN